MDKKLTSSKRFAKQGIKFWLRLAYIFLISFLINCFVSSDKELADAAECREVDFMFCIAKFKLGLFVWSILIKFGFFWFSVLL